MVEVIKAFRGLDSSRKDLVHASELVNLLSTFGEKMSKNEVAAVLKKMHINTNDKVPIAKILQYIGTPA